MNADSTDNPPALVEQWWLAELDQYGNAKLTDGPHADRDGVEEALYLFNRLGLSKERRLACARVEITQVSPISHGANEDALATLNSIGLQP